MNPYLLGIIAVAFMLITYMCSTMGKEAGPGGWIVLVIGLSVGGFCGKGIVDGFSEPKTYDETMYQNRSYK